MGTGHALSLRMQQRPSLAITPQLAQSIRMLAMGPAEIEALVAREVERNPFLARSGPAGGGGAISGASGGAAGGGEAIEAIGERAAEPVSLTRHLEAQIALAFRDRADAALARMLAGELDEAGYLREPAPALAARLSVDPGRLDRVLARCRGLEPAGLFARDLRDCLALQLDAREALDRAARAALDGLERLARGEIDALAAEAGVGRAAMRAALAAIRACDPKPGAGFGAAMPPPREAVARIGPDGAGGWRAELIGRAMPRVLVDHDYAAELRARHGGDDELREWVGRNLADASWLARSLARRARTVLRVTAELARRQPGFMERGEAGLRPLTLREVAAALELHESTVGRVVAGKAIETPRGTVAMRALFGAGVAGGEGGVAARAVQRRILDLVRAERPDAVLSDDRLTALLRAEGIAIARRTVAKYREGAGVAASPVRRRLKRAP